MNSLKTFLAVVIVCIDHNERGINHIFSSKHSLTGSPRLCPAFWQSSRDIVNILKSIVNSYIMRRANGGNAITDDLFEFLLNILTYNKYYMIETSFNRIMNRVIHDDMTSIIHWFQLLNSCSEATANTGCHDK